MAQNGTRKVQIALLGAGIFCREEHLPALLQSTLFEVRAVYSRSRKSAEALLEGHAGPDLEIYSEDTPGKGLDTLLAARHIEACDVVLPIHVQPEIIRKCWAAGKHVISEKPIAGTYAEALRLLKHYDDLPASKPLWAVAEQFRFMKFQDVLVNRIAGLGKLSFFTMEFYVHAAPGTKYYETQWRQSDAFPGYLVDGGVHIAAGLRQLLPSPPQTVVAFSSQVRPYLPPVDTFAASVRCQDGTSGTFNASFGSSHTKLEFYAVGEKGSLRCSLLKDATVSDAEGAEQEKITFEPEHAVLAELEAFGAAVLHSTTLDLRSRPIEALHDLSLIHHILMSGKQGGQPQQLP